MKCPPDQDWILLAMEALPEEQAAPLFTHARECPTCRELYASARRDHVDRVRMYEVFDQDHDNLREQLLAALPAEAPRRSPLDPLARGWHRLGDFTMTLKTNAPPTGCSPACSCRGRLVHCTVPDPNGAEECFLPQRSNTCDKPARLSAV